MFVSAQGGNVELTVRSELQHVVVGVSGRVESRTAPTLRDRLLRILNTEPPYVVLDISQVDRLDPAGLAVIAEAHRGAQLLGGWVRVVCPEQHARTLYVEDILSMVPRYESVREAAPLPAVPTKRWRVTLASVASAASGRPSG